MTIKVGDRVPSGTLWEFIEEETPGCSVGPNAFQVEDLVRGKRIAVFGLPGAFTPTCSAKHLPGFISNADSSTPPRSTRSGAFRSTTRSSWAPGAAIRGRRARCA